MVEVSFESVRALLNYVSNGGSAFARIAKKRQNSGLPRGRSAAQRQSATSPYTTAGDA